jgi:hypothetical protein
MTAAQTLSDNTLNAIQQRFDLREIGSPHITLTSPFGEVGQMRLFAGEAVHKMVYIGMTVPQIGLDSHMIFAFTPPHSPTPHFTLDSVMNAPDFAFHLDLIPRVDLGANLAYMDATLTPLTPTQEAAAQIEGLTPAKLSTRQYALMSPWMLVYRANETAFDAIQSPVKSYLDHWFGLVENGIPTDIAAEFDGAALAERDRRNRAAIFNPDVDRVWAQVDRLLGADMSAKMRAMLINQDVEA